MEDSKKSQSNNFDQISKSSNIHPSNDECDIKSKISSNLVTPQAQENDTKPENNQKITQRLNPKSKSFIPKEIIKDNDQRKKYAYSKESTYSKNSISIANSCFSDGFKQMPLTVPQTIELPHDVQSRFIQTVVQKIIEKYNGMTTKEKKETLALHTLTSPFVDVEKTRVDTYIYFVISVELEEITQDFLRLKSGLTPDNFETKQYSDGELNEELIRVLSFEFVKVTKLPRLLLWISDKGCLNFYEFDMLFSSKTDFVIKGMFESTVSLSGNKIIQTNQENSVLEINHDNHYIFEVKSSCSLIALAKFCYLLYKTFCYLTKTYGTKIWNCCFIYNNDWQFDEQSKLLIQYLLLTSQQYPLLYQDLENGLTNEKYKIEQFQTAINFVRDQITVKQRIRFQVFYFNQIRIFNIIYDLFKTSRKELEEKAYDNQKKLQQVEKDYSEINKKHTEINKKYTELNGKLKALQEENAQLKTQMEAKTDQLAKQIENLTKQINSLIKN